jgi:DNA mismatch repair protein MutL
VRDLFAATPARRKFLRTPATEVGHVVDVITRLAVASPGTGLRLEHDGREVLALPPVRERRQRLVQVLGRERATSLVEVEAAGAGFALAGFLGRPSEHVSSARLLWTYVGIGEGSVRWVRDRVLLRAVLDGYESLLLRGRYPVAVLFLRVPPGEVDVNVHPAKLEVRFRRPAAVHQLIAPALCARLAAALAPAAAAVGEATARTRRGRSCWRPLRPPANRVSRRGCGRPRRAGLRRCASSDRSSTATSSARARAVWC